MELPTFSAKIDAEVERAYGVVARVKLNPQLSFLKEQVISINDKYVATDKVVKRANKIGATRKTSKFSLSVWVEVESKDSRELITQCCQGKCKGKNAIAFFRTFAVLVLDSLEFDVPIIFFGAPSHNHRGKKAKFILKMQILEGNDLVAESTDCVIPYKQSSSKKRQRSAKEEESDLDSASGSQGNSIPSSPTLTMDNNNNNFSLSPKRHKSFQISKLMIPETKPAICYLDQAYYPETTQSLIWRPSDGLKSNSLNDITQYDFQTQDDTAGANFLFLISNQIYMNYLFSLPYDILQDLLERPWKYL